MGEEILIGIIGEFDPERESMVATVSAVEKSAKALGLSVRIEWVFTKKVEREGTGYLKRYDGLWCAPGNMYESFSGAMDAIRYAREARLPFFGTCAGFQHAVIEYARDVMGISNAAHEEVEPDAENPFIQSLKCSLRGKTMNVRAVAGSKAAQLYGRGAFDEQYYCSMGMSEENQAKLDAAGFKVVGVDADGEARIVELPEYPFYMATLFVPQRNLSKDNTHPLILGFVRACAAHKAASGSKSAVA